MKINGVNVAEYGAMFLTKRIVPCTVVHYNDWLSRAHSPVSLGKHTYTYSKIVTTLLVSGADFNALTLCVSNLYAAAAECELAFDDLEYTYHARLVTSPPEHINMMHQEVTLEFQADYKYGGEQTETFTAQSCELNLRGNTETPAVLTITPAVALADVKISINREVMTIYRLQQGKPVVIDGIEGLVTVDGKNKYADTDMFDFPLLSPGKNEITVNKPQCAVSLLFRPRWI